MAKSEERLSDLDVPRLELEGVLNLFCSHTVMVAPAPHSPVSAG